MNKIKEDDKIEVEEMLKSHLNPKLGGKIMRSVAGSIAHHWEQQGIEKGIKKGIEKGTRLANIKMKKEKITLAKKMLIDKEPLEKIINYTNLKKEEIEKLQ
ncbi:MAG: transposase [Rickettsia endosymbiont of Pentastiridius leporinus]